MRRCKRCVLPENFPHAALDAQGLCPLCRSHRGPVSPKVLRSYERRFRELARRLKGQGEYDVLVCFSGGKDSTYTLDLFKRRYGLRVLAFTFDNGFIPPATYQNIQRVVTALGVDHFFFKGPWALMKRIFRSAASQNPYPAKSLERASVICTSCMGFVKYAALKTAVEKDIPFIGFGWTPGQAPVTSAIIKTSVDMIRMMERMTRKGLETLSGVTLDSYFLGKRHYAKKDFPYLIHPATFEPYREEKILAAVRKLGWVRPKGLDPHTTNCLLNSLAIQNHESRFGFNPYVYELAQLVREGAMRRSTALARLETPVNAKTVKAIERRLR